MKLLLSPHPDDAVLFAAFTILKNKIDTVVTVFDSFRQPMYKLTDAQRKACGHESRRLEDTKALAIIGAPVLFAGLSDADPTVATADIQVAICALTGRADFSDVDVWAPMFEEGGHDQHNLVALAASELGAKSVKHYSTYVRGKGRTIIPELEVKPEYGWLVKRKLEAMLHYNSQITIDRLGCWPHFLDLREYCQQ